MLEKGSRLFLKKRIAAAFFLLIGGFMKYLINKNFLKSLAKSMNNEADSFRKIKAEILEHLRNIEKKENSELKKAVAHICENEHLFGYLEKSDSGEWVEKSGFGVGTVRTWRGKKYKKISVKPNRWVRVYDKTDRGAKNAITRLIHRAEKIESPEEMMQFVLANKQRFMDANGKPLDIVDRLKKVIDAKNAEYDSKLSTKENKKNNAGDNLRNLLKDRPKEEQKEILEKLAKRGGTRGKTARQVLKEDFGESAKQEFSGSAIRKREIKKISMAEKKAKKSKKEEKSPEEDYIRAELEQDERIGRAALWQQKVNTAIKTGDIEKIKSALEQVKKEHASMKTKTESEKEFVDYELKYRAQDAENAIKELGGEKQRERAKKTKTEADKYKKLQEQLKKEIANGERNNTEELKEDVEEWQHLLYIAEHDPRSSYSKEQTEHFREVVKIGEEELKRRLNKKTKTLSDIRNHYESSNSVTGNKKTIYAGDEKIKGHWKLVEADAPMASHDEKTFAKTGGFPQSKSGGTINDRDYEHDKDAQESVRDIAANFNGRALDMGEPVIVTKDGIVISGNNRTMSSKLAAKNGTDKQYLSDLKEQIEDFGFDEEDLDGFKHPRIVFEIDNEHEGDYTTEEFAMFNKTGKKAKNATEKAVEISKTIKSEAVRNVADVISGYDTMGEMWADRDASRKIMSSFVESGVIGKNDMAQYYTEEGGMSAAGKEFVETCLIGSIMNETNIRTLSGDGGKAIRQKLVRAIVPLIENKGDGNEYSFNSELNEAVRIASFVAKNHGTYPTIKTYFDQQDMFESEANPIVKKLAELIHDNTQKEFAQQMKNLEAGIRPNAAGEMDIFLGECETRNSVITRILRIKDTVKKSIFTTFDYVQKSIENLKKCRAI